MAARPGASTRHIGHDSVVVSLPRFGLEPRDSANRSRLTCIVVHVCWHKKVLRRLYSCVHRLNDIRPGLLAGAIGRQSRTGASWGNLAMTGISLGHTCPQVYQPTIFRLFVCKYCTSKEWQCCRIGVDSQSEPARVLPPHSHRRAGLPEQLSSRSPASWYRYLAPCSPRALAKTRIPPF